MDKIKIAGTWRNVADLRVKVSGIWEAVKYVFEKIETTEHYVDPDTNEEFDESYNPDGSVPPSYKNVLKLGRAFAGPEEVPDAPSLSVESTDPTWEDDGTSSPPPDEVTATFPEVDEGIWNPKAGGGHTWEYNLEWFWLRKLVFFWSDGTPTGQEFTIDDPEQTEYIFTWPEDEGDIYAKMRYVNGGGSGPYSAASNTVHVESGIPDPE